MSMQDPVADMLTRIRNAQMAGKPDVAMPASKAEVGFGSGPYRDEGFCSWFSRR